MTTINIRITFGSPGQLQALIDKLQHLSDELKALKSP